jgi:hypothetical protein
MKANDQEKGHIEKINLNNNVSAKYAVKTPTRTDQDSLLFRIKNPLAHLSRHEVLDNVENFAREFDLIDILPLLRKGALIARDPAQYEKAELTDSERTAIHNETVHKWRQPVALYFTIVLCSIGAAVQ